MRTSDTSPDFDLRRVDGLIDGATTLVNYAYLGLGVAVQETYPEPSFQYTLLGSSTGTSPAGDIYWGLDQFGRIIDSYWLSVVAALLVCEKTTNQLTKWSTVEGEV